MVLFAKRNREKPGKLIAQPSDPDSHVNCRQRVEFGARLGVDRCGSGEIPALGMKKRDRRLYKALVIAFLLAAASLPQGLPYLMAFEEPARVEKRGTFLEQPFFFLCAHHVIVCRRDA